MAWKHGFLEFELHRQQICVKHTIDNRCIDFSIPEPTLLGPVPDANCFTATFETWLFVLF